MGVLKNSLVSLGCEINGTVENSILSNNVIVKKGAVIKDSVIFGGAVIEENAQVICSVIDEGAVIGKNAQVGAPFKGKDHKIAVVGREFAVAENRVIGAGEIVEDKD